MNRILENCHGKPCKFNLNKTKMNIKAFLKSLLSHHVVRLGKPGETYRIYF